MTTSIASDEQWPVAIAKGPAPHGPAPDARAIPGGRNPLRSTLGYFDDAALLLLVALLFPVVILLIGTPVALLVRLLVLIAHQL